MNCKEKLQLESKFILCFTLNLALHTTHSELKVMLDNIVQPWIKGNNKARF